MDVLKKINKMRIDRNWSVYRLSVESGVSQSTLTNMFNRETFPSIATLECICSAFGITMSEFFAEACDKENSAEQEVVNLYRALKPDVQNSVLILLRELSPNN